MKALQITFTIPPGTLWWPQFIESVANDPAYAPLVASYNDLQNYFDPTVDNGVTTKKRIIVYPENLNMRSVQWRMSDLPEGYDAEQAYVFYRKKMREFILSHNDAPYTESAEESFDGISRTIPRNLALSFFLDFNEVHGFELTGMELVDVDF